jgi:alanine racemase
MYRPTAAEIDLTAIRDNLRAIRACTPLRTQVIGVVKADAYGHGIGYGRTFITDQPTRMALIPIGYADGYLRALSNKAHVILRGRFAPVIGRVSMDVCAIDVSDIPAAMPGDPVTLIGEQDGLVITAEDLARLMGTISYEVLTGISKRVPRVYLERRT